MNAKLILSNLAKFRYRTAMATGLSETAVLEILQEEARRNAAMRGVPQNDGEPQEPPQHAVKPQKPSQKVRKKHKESSNEKTDDNIEDNGQSGVVQDMKFNLEIETIVVKAEPVDYYNEEPAMNIEPEHAKALNDEQVQIEPIFIHVKLEPPDEEMNEPHTQDESLTTGASSSYQPTETLHDIKNEPQAETLPVVKADPVQYHKEKIVKTKAQRQKEYRQRKKMENRTERKIRKTNAQYHQTYREKQKKKQLSESEESKHARNKANAERAKRYRENKKIQLQSEPLDSSLARKKNNAERTKRYREKLKSIKKYIELETVQSFPTVSMESNEETDIIFNQFQKNRIQSSVNDEAQSSLLGEREIKVEKIEIGEEGYS